MKRVNFTSLVKRLALARQRNRCGSCGERIWELGEEGRNRHRFGESAHAHHIRHTKFGGTNAFANCVILCQACHYSVHEGGNYRHGQVQGTPDDYHYYAG